VRGHEKWRADLESILEELHVAGVLLGAGDGAEAALLLAPLEGPQHGVSVLQLDWHCHE
jgi:hypothetical protein